MLDFSKPREVLPRGSVRGSFPGTIAPTWSNHKGVSMYPDSAIARALLSVPENERE